MGTNHGPAVVLQQLLASDRRKRSLHPQLYRAFGQQDQRVFGLLIRFQSGEQVAESLLTELLPAVDAKVARLRAVRLYGRDDLRQELAAEILYVARRLPVRRSAFITRRLILQATRRLTRRLEREWYRQLDEWYRQLADRSGSGPVEGAAGDEE